MAELAMNIVYFHCIRARYPGYTFTARQHAMHEECDIILPILSVCLSVRPMAVLCLNEWIYRSSTPFGDLIWIFTF